MARNLAVSTVNALMVPASVQRDFLVLLVNGRCARWTAVVTAFASRARALASMVTLVQPANLLNAWVTATGMVPALMVPASASMVGLALVVTTCCARMTVTILEFATMALAFVSWGTLVPHVRIQLALWDALGMVCARRAAIAPVVRVTRDLTVVLLQRGQIAPQR